MHITKALPAEFSTGHVGRLIRLNAGRSRIGKLLSGLQCKGDVSMPGKFDRGNPIRAVAQMLDVDVSQYASTHTLLPFYSYAFRSECSQPDRWREGHYARFGFSSLNESAALCEECVIEDLDLLGFSIWRREHQLPGVRWCAAHNCALRFVAGRSKFLSSPASCLPSATPFDVPARMSDADPALLRYQEVATFMLRRGAPPSLSLMRDRLAARAKALELSLCKKSAARRRLSDRVVDLVPPAWLKEVLPWAANRGGSSTITCVDSVTRCLVSGTSSAQAFAIAMVALFETSGEAIEYVFNPARPTSIPLRSREDRGTAHALARTSETRPTIKAEPYQRRARHAPDGYTFLARAYLKHAGDLEKVAADLGVSVERVKERMSHRKPFLAIVRDEPEYRALLGFLAGKTLVQACEQYGVSLSCMEAMLRMLHRKVELPDADPLLAAAHRSNSGRHSWVKRAEV
jgi:TniQ